MAARWFIVLVLAAVAGLACDQEEMAPVETCRVETSSVVIPAADRWTRVTDTNTPQQFHSVVVVGGKVYVVGGGQTERFQASAFEVYDPDIDRWDILPAMPTARVFLAAAAVGNAIYAISGIRIAQGAILNDFDPTVEAFDLTSQTWTQRADVPTPRNRFAAATFAGRIYAIGGLTPDGDTGIVEAYDPATDRWERGADMPTPRHGHGLAIANELIYVIGGGPMEAYDPVGDRWMSLASVAPSQRFLGVAASKGFVYAIGGRVSLEAPPVARYNPCDDVWDILEPMPGSFRNRFDVGVVDDKIYVVGGELQRDDQIPISVYRYDPDNTVR